MFFLSKQFVALEQTQYHPSSWVQCTTQRVPPTWDKDTPPGCLWEAQLAALSEVRIVPRASQYCLIHPPPQYKQLLIYGDSIVALGPELEIKANRHHLP